MSRRLELEQRLRKLGEIGEIMRSMKNLSLMETRKLARFLDAQEESVRLIEAVAADFLDFHPQFRQESGKVRQVTLVIGSERGFCGDYNEELLKSIDALMQTTDSPILAVGNKLAARLERHPLLAGQFDGPSVAEDVPAILNQLVTAIGRLQTVQDSPGLTVLHHRNGEVRPVSKPLLPPFTQSAHPGDGQRHPPLLNLPAARFFADLVQHYLFAALHEIFYTSLMAENLRRIQHLDGAIQRLEEKNAALSRQARALRQEEITEEIEVILLSAEGLIRR